MKNREVTPYLESNTFFQENNNITADTTSIRIETKKVITSEIQNNTVTDYTHSDNKGYGFSLNKIKNLKNEAKTKLDNVVLQQSQTPDIETLNDFWKALVATYTEGKSILKSSFDQGNITCENDTIRICMEGLSLELVKEKRTEILRFFKTKYHNENIILDIQLLKNTQEQNTNILLSNRELYELMCKKNPYLKQLKEQLRLDFE